MWMCGRSSLYAFPPLDHSPSALACRAPLESEPDPKTSNTSKIHSRIRIHHLNCQNSPSHHPKSLPQIQIQILNWIKNLMLIKLTKPKCPLKFHTLATSTPCKKQLHIGNAHKVFDQMPVPDYRQCNALLRAHTASGEHSKSISLLRWMLDKHLWPDGLALAAAIKSVSALLDSDVLGRCLHGFVVKAGYAVSAAVAKAVMGMYGRFCTLADSRRVFDEMESQDAVSWNILLTGYARAGFCENVFDVFYSMHCSGIKECMPTAVTVAVVVPVCAKLRLLPAARSIHGYVIKVGLESDTLAGNALVSMYAKCGRAMDDADRAFSSICRKDVVSWNSIIAGYSENGLFEEAFRLFSQMVSKGFHPNYSTLANILPICAFMEHGSYYGKEVHCFLVRHGLEMVISVCNALLTHYSKVGDMTIVESIFRRMNSRDIVTWNTVIAASVMNGHHSRALDLFHELLSTGAVPDSVTFISVLPACAQLGHVKEGRRIHGYILRHPLLLRETSLMNALVSFYSQCGGFGDALRAFTDIPKRDMVSWNAILSACANSEQTEEFFRLLSEMRREGTRWDSVTILNILRVSVSCGIRIVREAHGYSLRVGFTGETWVANAILDAYAKCGYTEDADRSFRNFEGRNVVTANTMISCYLKNGCLEDAEMIFNQMAEKDLTSWNLMVQLYAQNDMSDEAFRLFHVLQSEGLKPDTVSITSILLACIRLASARLLRQCHGYVLRASLGDIHLEGALLDAYAKCGNVNDARNLFRVSPEKDLVTFTAMVGGYAMHGMAEEAVGVFSQMQALDIKPDHVILTALLSACSHAGLVDAGLKLFESIGEIHGVEPTAEHYACMVDLLARGGRLRDAYNLISGMLPHQANASVWGALLGACKIHGEVEIGRLAANRLFSMEAGNIGNYIVMSNIYAAGEKWDGVEQVRRLMKAKDLKKPAGCSWIEVEKTRHSFAASDVRHPDRSWIYDMLKSLDQQIKDPLTQNIQL